MKKQRVLEVLAGWFVGAYTPALIFWLFVDLFTIALTIVITDESEPSLPLRLSFLVFWLVTMGLLDLFVGMLIGSCRNTFFFLVFLAMASWAWIAIAPGLLAFISEYSQVNLPIVAITVWGLAAIYLGAGPTRHFFVDS